MNSSSKTTTNIPAEERALVLQGGGSLGAYEAGAYKALYEWLSKEDKKEGKETSMTFDNIAGTSIGAMNAEQFSQAMLLKMALMRALQRDL